MEKIIKVTDGTTVMIQEKDGAVTVSVQADGRNSVDVFLNDTLYAQIEEDWKYIPTNIRPYFLNLKADMCTFFEGETSFEFRSNEKSVYMDFVPCINGHYVHASLSIEKDDSQTISVYMSTGFESSKFNIFPKALPCSEDTLNAFLSQLEEQKLKVEELLQKLSPDSPTLSNYSRFNISPKHWDEELFTSVLDAMREMKELHKQLFTLRLG